MAMEVNRPNVVMDDNYKMFVKALARRYAERGASVYTNADAIEQERKNTRTRAMAPDAYRLSKEGPTAADLYKNGTDGETKYMTTDDYLAYFSKCHDTFDAVNYYALHKEVKKEEAEPSVIVNQRRLAEIRKMKEKKKSVRYVRVSEETLSDKIAEFFTAMGATRRRVMAGMSAVAVSMMLFAGGLFLFTPDEPASARYVQENSVEEEIVDVAMAEQE